jgi:hypothetical protein
MGRVGPVSSDRAAAYDRPRRQGLWHAVEPSHTRVSRHPIGPGDRWAYAACWTDAVRSGHGTRSAPAPVGYGMRWIAPQTIGRPHAIGAGDRQGQSHADGSRPRRSARRMRSAQETARAGGMRWAGPIRLRRDIRLAWRIRSAHAIRPSFRTNDGGGSSRIEESTFSTERDGEGGVTAGVSARIQP